MTAQKNLSLSFFFSTNLNNLQRSNDSNLLYDLGGQEAMLYFSRV